MVGGSEADTPSSRSKFYTQANSIDAFPKALYLASVEEQDTDFLRANC